MATHRLSFNPGLQKPQITQNVWQRLKNEVLTKFGSILKFQDYVQDGLSDATLLGDLIYKIRRFKGSEIVVRNILELEDLVLGHLQPRADLS